MVAQDGLPYEANLCPGSSGEVVCCGQKLPGQVLRWRQGHLQGKVKRKEFGPILSPPSLLP